MDSYLDENDGIPVIIVPESLDIHDKNIKKQINGDLAEATESPYSWPLAGYEAIAGVLKEYDIELPGDFSDNSEIVLALKEEGDSNPEKPEDNQLYLYICHEENEHGDLEFYAEIVTEPELHDLLDEFDDDADENSGNDENY